MKNLNIIILLTCSCIAAQGQVLNATQEKQVKAKVDSIAKVLRAEVKVWTDSKRTIDSTQNMRLKGIEDSTITVRLDSSVIIQNSLITAKLPAFELLQKIQSSIQQQADAAEKLRKSIPIITYPLQ